MTHLEFKTICIKYNIPMIYENQFGFDKINLFQFYKNKVIGSNPECLFINENNVLRFFPPNGITGAGDVICKNITELEDNIVAVIQTIKKLKLNRKLIQLEKDFE